MNNLIGAGETPNLSSLLGILKESVIIVNAYNTVYEETHHTSFNPLPHTRSIGITPEDGNDS
jgi:hypothetical protein